MDPNQPVGGWDSLLTKEYLDLRLQGFEARIRNYINRQILWLVPTLLAGMIVAPGLVAWLA